MTFARHGPCDAERRASLDFQGDLRDLSGMSSQIFLCRPSDPAERQVLHEAAPR